MYAASALGLYAPLIFLFSFFSFFFFFFTHGQWLFSDTQNTSRHVVE